MSDHSLKPSTAEPATVTFRPERPEDEAFLFAVYASTREEELALTGWNEAARQAFLQLQFRAMRQGYAQSYPEATFCLILQQDRPIGRLVVNRSVEEIRLVDIALLPEQRGQGIGSYVLRQLLAEGAQSGKPVRLQVLSHNRALRLYERLGFRRLGEPDVRVWMEWRGGTAVIAPGG